MKTTKPISSISWNSRNYLVDRLEELRKAHLIAFWVLVKHTAEEDEKKDHIHFYVEPNRSIDTELLREKFIELVPGSKPLGVNKFQKSDFQNWLWYCLHDKAYLLSKGETRKYHYSIEDLISSDDGDLRQRIQENPRPESEYSKVEELIQQGLSNEAIAQTMNVPLFRFEYFCRAVEKLRTLGETYRADRKPSAEEDETQSTAETDINDDDLPF